MVLSAANTFWDKISLFQEFMLAIAVCASVAIVIQLFGVFVEKQDINDDEAYNPVLIRNKIISTSLGVWFWLGYILSFAMNEYLACFVGFLITIAVGGILIFIFKKDVIDLRKRISEYKKAKKENKENIKLLEAPKPKQLSIDDVEQEVIELGNHQVQEPLKDEAIQETTEKETTDEITNQEETKIEEVQVEQEINTEKKNEDK